MRFDSDALGNRMKAYEASYSSETLIPLLPIVIRLDGKAFHGFTKGLARPYDKGFSDLMVETTKFLVSKTNSFIGYTQSDELSLVIYAPDYRTDPLFGGRVLKWTSILSSMCTAFFNSKVKDYIPKKEGVLAFFDCRVFNVPNLTEAANVLVWRELDAFKNSISMAAQSHFSHNALQNKNGSEMQEMLFSKGINFNDYPSFFKRGSYVRRSLKTIPFSAEEISKLPAKHEAHKNPNFMVTRSVIERLDLPPILKIVNREEVLFDGAAPILFEGV